MTDDSHTPGNSRHEAKAASRSDLLAPCGFCGHDPRFIVLDPDVWTRIVFAAKESDDWRLRTLIDQAVMGPVLRD